MKRLKLFTKTTLFLVLGNAAFAQQATDLPSDIDGVSPSWFEQVKKDISAREYIMRRNETESNQFRAFNRSNNLIGQLKPGSMSLTPQPDSEHKDVSWQAELQTTAILFNGKVVHVPSNSALITKDNNTLEFHHADFVEQYVNNEDGLRQNFIIQDGPQSKEIRVELALKGLRAEKRNDTEIALYNQTLKGDLQTYTLYKDLKSWDAHGIPLASHFEVADNRVSLVVNSENAAYPITIDPISVAPAPTTMLEENQASAYFGCSVASGDVNNDGYDDVLVGAYGYDGGQTSEGAVYIYHGSASGLSTTAAVRLESNVQTAWFGCSVASGDVNNDGYDDVIVGAERYTGGQTSEGAVYIFHGSASGVSSSYARRLESNIASAYFGISVASGDVNNDNYDDVIVGSYRYNVGTPTYQGAAFVYHGSASGIPSSYARRVMSGQSGSQFGMTLASGDVNNDNYDDVIVGAPNYDNGSVNDGGAFFVYHGSASGMSSSHSALISSAQSRSNFGYALATGDADGDGYADVLVGAEDYDDGQTNEGHAFLFFGASSGLSTTATDTFQENKSSAHYGDDVALVDVNNDGYDDVLVGSSTYSKGTVAEGVVFVYHGSSSGASTTSNLAIESNQASAYFGHSIASAGDINGDGYEDLIIGSYYYDNGQNQEGAAFVYHGSTDGLRPECGTNPLPTNLSTTYTGAYATTDANGWTNYCSSDHLLLLSLDTAGSGAVVAANEVQLKLGSDTTVSHGADGGMIKNTDGYLLLDRLWDVNPTTQPSGEVGVRYYFTNAEYNALVSAAGSHTNSRGASKPTTIAAVTAMEFYKTSGTAFAMPHTSSTGIVYTNGSSASTSNWLYAAKGSDHSAEFNVTSFSGGGGGAGAANASLPVELLAFTATQADQHTAMLRWTTATEINNNRFEIERSYDGRTFEVVGDVAGNGNSQHQIDYSYTDASVSKVQKTVYYRLKQVDFDGTFEYSDIRVVRFDAVGNDMQLVAYPNPMNDELNVMVGLSNGESYQLEVTNLQGKLVHQENHTYDNGIHKLNTYAWNSGMYIVRVATKHATKHMKVVKK